MLLNCILITVLVVATVSTSALLYVDYRHVKNGKKSAFWVKKN